MMIRTAGRTVDLTEQRAFSLTDMAPYGWKSFADSGGNGINVNDETTYGLPAFARAVRIYAESLAMMELGAYTGDGPTRRKVIKSPQAQLFQQIPNPQQTRFQFWETVASCCIVPRNAYIWKMKIRGRVAEWYALDTNQVDVKIGNNGQVTYRVRCGGPYVDPVGKGSATYDLAFGDLIHIAGAPGRGRFPISLIEQHKDALAADIALQKYEGRVFGKNAKLEYAISFPRGLNRGQAREYREQFKQTHQGPQGENVLVLGDGADIKPIGMSNTDAQLVALSRMSTEKAAQIVGLPSTLLGAVDKSMDAKPLEQVMAEWLKFGFGGLLGRIESALEADPDIYPGPSSRPGFMTEGFIRGDLITEDTILHNKVQSGRWTPDEARAVEGMPPLPDGLGAKPIITPVGGAPNPGGQPPSGGKQPPKPGTKPPAKKEEDSNDE